ncbi:sulfurtransferase TusA family protein [Vibrio sp. SM6]|uniref:Sulfurtransferase TusA family protein n=1 Tax=Vibrio agarilyticus TaxID=2726741 RepID=A0A7X8YGN8_9VIBR|nr:sulfurtransferase TusA family protein [Vibrio agarilyticus]NLS13193.1 sulfurtransferase TusA family protein [Vibrio agarilyticus]
MELQHLDLRGERCPMALLRAKRFAAEFSSPQPWTLSVSDAASMQDIQRYFLHCGWQIQCQTQATDYLLMLYPSDFKMPDSEPAHWAKSKANNAAK